MLKLIWLIRELNRLRRRCDLLEEKLDAERAANRAHEDEILSRFVTYAGVIGVEARQPEKRIEKAKPPEPVDFESAIKNLNEYDRAILEMYEIEGVARGFDQGKIHEDFYQEHILGRQRIEEVPQ